MDFKAILFDTTLDGRRLIQTAFKHDIPSARLTVRSRSESFLQALRDHPYDVVLLGLPVEARTFDQILLQLTHTRTGRPRLFLLGDKGGDYQGLGLAQVSKNPAGLRSLFHQLPHQVRADRISGINPGDFIDLQQLASAHLRTLVAEKTIQALQNLNLKCMYISIDPMRGRWIIRASSYPADVLQVIRRVVEKGEQVAPRIDAIPDRFKSLLQGKESLNHVSLEDLFSVVLPWATKADVKRLQNALDLKTVFLLPVIHQGHVHGILAIEEVLHEPLRDSIQAYSSRFARALSQASAMDELQSRAKGLLALQEVLVSVSSILDPGKLLNEVLSNLAKVVAFDGGRIYLIEEGRIHLKALFGQKDMTGEPTWLMQDLNGSDSDFSRCIESGTSCLRSEVSDQTVLGEPGSNPDWRSWIVSPIIWRNQISGILTLSSNLPGFFNPLHLEIANTISQQLGVALDNSLMLEASNQRAEKLKIIHEIGRSSVSLLDTQLLVFEAAQKVIQIFHYDQVGIFMVDEDVLIPEIYLYGQDLHERKGIGTIKLNAGTFFDEAVRSNVPVIVNDLKGEPGLALIPGTGKARGAILMPLSIKGAVVGVMLILSYEEDGVDPNDLEILQILAAQLGISLVNARLFSEVRAHAAKLEQRVAERTDELQSQKERTEAILRSVADGVMVLDLEGRLVLANPTAQALLSGVWSEQLYQRVLDLQMDEDQRQTSWEFGNQSFEALASNVDLENQVIGTVVVLRNITRLKELDRLKSQFVATVSHELRTPLANIKLYLSLLRRSQVDPESHYFQTLNRETDRLTTMIEDLLDLSRLETEPQDGFQLIHLGDLLTEIAETQKPVCASKRLTLKYEPGINPKVWGNQDRLIQVFTNLMANAISYTPAGNTIWIRIDVTGRSHQRGVVIEVEDSGMGIPADELPYVFDRFYRGRMAQQLKIHGSGLGLSIVREIVESHGGTISVRSDIGKGTCFQIWLPIGEGGDKHHG